MSDVLTCFERVAFSANDALIAPDGTRDVPVHLRDRRLILSTSGPSGKADCRSPRSLMKECCSGERRFASLLACFRHRN